MTNNYLRQYEVWFITGSQKLYGEEVLKQVDRDSEKIVEYFNNSEYIPVKIVFKPVVTTPGGIYKICMEASTANHCVGLITWMHTFSPAKMWIGGLQALQKPFVHLHTQFNRDIPWPDIDMDFMNLNQSAHGGREFGFMASRLRIERKVITGYWKDPSVLKRLGSWIRSACGWHEMKKTKVARFGDNMREVAVTEGDKVEAQMRFGFSVHGFGVGDLVEKIKTVGDEEINELVRDYEKRYRVCNELGKGGTRRDALLESVRIEAGMRKFLEGPGFTAFTTSFEELHGMSQLPGAAVQRLMSEGYGFGAEGDWKTAALVRAMKVMAAGLPGGTSFMEDYTYHLDPSGMKVLGAHMLELCESLADGKPSLEIHPLSIGGKSDPVRLVFNVAPGNGLNATIVDMGNRFRMVVNTVQMLPVEKDLPKLPVARGIWAPEPDLPVAASAWILAGGAHHAVFSHAVSAEMLEDLCEMAGIEYILIDNQTDLAGLKKELRWNEVYYHFNVLNIK